MVHVSVFTVGNGQFGLVNISMPSHPWLVLVVLVLESGLAATYL